MLIALDYDDTYTRDPTLWDMLITAAKQRGHSVIVVTMRYKEEGAEVEKALRHQVESIHYTGRKAKRPYLASMMIHPSIWIDDEPSWILFGSDTTHENSHREFKDVPLIINHCD